ncbi:efflux transporter outer membrane subunit [Candidatus Odyssella acanthamoebae]|uniref:efflux transporter outer membrane subunit n=1 Tax=Candidatus Odyssella acanthamoebae TaxID=91604 RepID=UPI000A070409|nr:TolC family protein [Candidatus Paracaedibacter acanthamoebae]
MDKSKLKEWWKQFEDENLNWLIEQTLKESPDIHQAAARIDEARGLQKTAFGSLLPAISGSADVNRGKQLFLKPITGDSYDASFDASYEFDLFGKNREAFKAAENELLATLQDYDWIKLSIIAEVIRTYISMRAAEKQIVLAQHNLEIQKDTLALVERQFKAGSASEFDVKRTALQVHQSTARIADYNRQKEVYMLSLLTLTGLTAELIKAHLTTCKEIPGIDLKAIADAPASVIARRPDITAANLRFIEATSLRQSQLAAFFPTLSLSSLFGLSQTVLVPSTTVWNIGGKTAVSLLDFGRIQGQIDAASAREVTAYEAWRKAILQGLQDVETALTNTARYEEQRHALNLAKINAAKAVSLSQTRYRQGDNSLLDVLDAQRHLIETDQALIEVENSYVIAIVALYKALGQY